MFRQLIFDFQRRHYRRRCSNGVMADFLAEQTPDLNAAFADSSFLVADLETTGLDSATGEVASVGWVAIDNGVLDLETARHLLVKLEQEVGQSAVYHQLSDSELESGIGIQQALVYFLAAAQGRTLVFHNASLDMSFINKVCRDLYGVPLHTFTVDTLLLEKNRYLRHSQGIENGVLRLFACRQRYGLPDYPMHDALIDAISTGELLMAQVAHMGGTVKLNELV